MWYLDALYRDRWKIVRVTEQRGGPEWQLYDLRSDPSETTDLSEEHAALREELIGDWERIAAESGAQLDFAIQ